VNAAGTAGALYERELLEQPAVLGAIARRGAEFEQAARAIRASGCTLIRLVGHGSSDNAASYGTYAFGLAAGLTAFRDSISLSVYYGAELDLRGSCVIALSQSGQTPDVVAYLERAAARGAHTVAVTNDPGSPLAEHADTLIALESGSERAVAATKTYSSELAVLAMLAAQLGGGGAAMAEALTRTSSLLHEWLAEPPGQLEELAGALRPVQRLLVLGRGPEFATARELALKLLETSRLAAAPLTATDFAHGPVAALAEDFPTWLIASNDASLPTILDAAMRAAETGAPVIASGSAAAAVAAHARFVLPVPEAPLPLLAPLLSIVPGQLLALTLARAKGLDPDHPVGLAKVTLAR
jgi:glucosamine--fructose-6-phosphate aminotransferase (isomerizing)